MSMGKAGLKERPMRFSEIEGLSISQRNLEERLKEYRTESENRSDVAESAQNRRSAVDNE